MATSLVMQSPFQVVRARVQCWERSLCEAVGQPTTSDTKITSGRARAADEDWDGALARFDHAILLDPQNAHAHSDRGYVKEKKNDVEGALRDYAMAILLDNKCIEAYCNRGILRKSQGDLKGGLEDLNEAIKLNPELSQAVFHRGAIRDTLGELEGAMADYTKAIKLNPKLVEAYQNRSALKARTNDTEGALEDSDEAVRLQEETSPTSPSFQRLIAGRAKVQNEDWDGAFADFNKAIELDPNNAEAYNDRGYLKVQKADKIFVLRNNGHMKEKQDEVLRDAMADYTKALTLDSNCSHAFSNRGFLRKREQDLKGALEDFDAALKVNPSLCSTFLARGHTKELLGDLSGAMADYNEAIKLKPDFAAAYKNRSNLKENRDASVHDKKGAAKDIAEAIRLDSSIAMDHIEFKLGKWSNKVKNVFFPNFDDKSNGGYAPQKEVTPVYSIAP